MVCYIPLTGLKDPAWHAEESSSQYKQPSLLRLVPECETFHSLPVLQLQVLIWDRNQIYFCAGHELPNVFKSKDHIFKTNLFWQ